MDLRSPDLDVCVICDPETEANNGGVGHSSQRDIPHQIISRVDLLLMQFVEF